MHVFSFLITTSFKCVLLHLFNVMAKFESIFSDQLVYEYLIK